MNDLNPQLNNLPPAAGAGTTAGPGMSTAETLTSIFFEPGRTFEFLRERPRFLIAALIITIAFASFYFLFIQRVGYENMVRAQTEASQPEASAEQKEQVLEIRSRPFVKLFTYAVPIIGLLVSFAAGSGIYLLGTMAMGGKISYKQALAVYTYASFPPSVLSMMANIALLFLRSVDGIDAARDMRGLAQSNPGALFDPVAHPVLVTAFSALDLFQIYGLFLAALGLRKVSRLSAGAAWAVVLTVWLLGVVLRVLLATITGNAS